MGTFTYGASASHLPSRHGGREPVSTARRRGSGVRTLTNRGPAAFPAPSSQIPLASTCLATASSFCGRSFQTRKTSTRSPSREAGPPFGVLFFFIKRDGRSRFFSQVDLVALLGVDAFEMPAPAEHYTKRKKRYNRKLWMRS